MIVSLILQHTPKDVATLLTLLILQQPAAHTGRAEQTYSIDGVYVCVRVCVMY